VANNTMRQEYQLPRGGYPTRGYTRLRLTRRGKMVRGVATALGIAASLHLSRLAVRSAVDSWRSTHARHADIKQSEYTINANRSELLKEHLKLLKGEEDGGVKFTDALKQLNWSLRGALTEPEHGETTKLRREAAIREIPRMLAHVSKKTGLRPDIVAQTLSYWNHGRAMNLEIGIEGHRRIVGELIREYNEAKERGASDKKLHRIMKDIDRAKREVERFENIRDIYYTYERYIEQKSRADKETRDDAIQILERNRNRIEHLRELLDKEKKLKEEERKHGISKRVGTPNQRIAKLPTKQSFKGKKPRASSRNPKPGHRDVPIKVHRNPHVRRL